MKINMPENELISLAWKNYAENRQDKSESIFRILISAYPSNVNAYINIGMFYERKKDHLNAVGYYEKAMLICPGHALPHTRRSLILLRRLWGGPPLPRPTENKSQGRVTMSSLGANGRLGNQILQFGFIKIYGKLLDLEVQVPDWIGRDIFDADDPLPTAPMLPRCTEDKIGPLSSINSLNENGLRDVDIWGYFCGYTGHWANNRELFRSFFHFGKKASSVLSAPLEKIKYDSDKTIVAIHLRRGDFGYGRFWIAPSIWYIDWLSGIWPTLRNPVLYIATDDRKILDDFLEFSPISEKDIGKSPEGAEFLVDFAVLRNADVVAISNSTFSFTAAMLNEKARIFVRPSKDKAKMVSFDPWDSDVLL